MPSFRSLLESGARLLFDGAMGTMLQLRGLGPGQNPEAFCLQRPDILEGIHAEYVLAGADVLTTNTFGGSSYKLPPGVEARDFNRRMAQSARKAAAAAGRPVFVAGSVGPSGKFLRPLGDAGFDELTAAFQEQIRGLLEGGVDLILAETQFDIAEARAIVIAARRECSLPIAVSMTYEDGVTLTGSDPAVCAATLANLGVDMIGMNCSAGPVEMRAAADELLAASPVPVLVEPNAGLPLLRDGGTVFPLGPEEFASLTAAFARSGAQAVGGCCGTSPAHIAALAGAVRDLARPEPRPRFRGVALSSRSRLLRIGPDYPLRIIGERINPTGKKQLGAELRAGEFSTALRFADEQFMNGVPALDVNVGAPMVDEEALLPDLVSRLCSLHPLPLSIDSSNMEAVEKALAVYPASPLVNSISGEEGRLERLGPLCRDHGAPFILLPLRGGALPVLARERIAVVEDMLLRMEALGVPRRLALVDALVLTVSANPEAAKECLDFIRYCDREIGLPTVCGLSNVSFGLPARELVNAAFLGLAAAAGLNACIANPANARFMETIDATNLLLGHDDGAGHFIARYSGYAPRGGAGAGAPVPDKGGAPGAAGSVAGSVAGPDTGSDIGAAADPLADPAAGAAAPALSGLLEQAVIAGRREAVEERIQKALDAGEEPFSIVRERLIPAITEVGAKYERKEYFLPQLIRSAESMQAAFALLKPLLEKDSRAQSRPLIVMATVEGDIHDIGKNIVNLMLGNHGFEVLDLGKDVPAAAIVKAAEESGAGLIGLSALMTTTMVRMRETVALLRQKNLPQRVLVGGAVVSEDFARSIGAHYAKDAVEAVRLAQRLL
ncbi:homocysteine S-methyltransferase family protein [Desulfovibrio sp. OttesenSCG-928-A18]|nr:homocysteine S-methyltransferase family protein [Desulfovibrio sp. OttesenSCG-928-A18]